MKVITGDFWENGLTPLDQAIFMFHMLSCFNLKAGITIDEFQKSLLELDLHLKKKNLIHSTGRIGCRMRHPIMDTDSQRDHEYFFIMTFEDRDQCDRSVEHVSSGGEAGHSFHRVVWQKVSDPVFICWEDI